MRLQQRGALLRSARLLPSHNLSEREEERAAEGRTLANTLNPFIGGEEALNCGSQLLSLT